MSDQLVAETSNNTKHSQQTNIHASGGIRTHNLSRRAAADLRLRRSGHWDRRSYNSARWKLLRYNYSIYSIFHDSTALVSQGLLIIEAS